MLKFSAVRARAVACTVFALLLAGLESQGQTPETPDKRAAAPPTVTKIDIKGLKEVLKPNGKPRLVNFWATWCDPCREEFPDLVKLDAAYKGKIDFVTVSLDDLADINTLVPKFLGEMKAEMPAYLLSTPDEDTAISLVSKSWNGNLPLTILYSATGETAYLRMGKIRGEVVSAEINKLLTPVVKTDRSR